MVSSLARRVGRTGILSLFQIFHHKSSTEISFGSSNIALDRIHYSLTITGPAFTRYLGRKVGRSVFWRYISYIRHFLLKAVEITQRYKAVLSIVHYWSNHCVQPGQKSRSDWYYVIISNISQQVFHRNFIWFIKHHFDPKSLLTDHYRSIYIPVRG